MCYLGIAGKDSGIACASTRLGVSSRPWSHKVKVICLSTKAPNAELEASIYAT